ncbi:MAG TPA: CsgG/HfaB family protein [Spirochaetota bacterium]|nr:CsgG/HfaB family protein [Spirochaetota bacterium]
MKKHLPFIITIAWIGLSACSTIDIAITKKVDVSKKLNKVAVFPFDVKGAAWGDEFSDAISHYFFKTGRVEVVEREALERILNEQNLSMTGFIDDKSAVKIGKLLVADVILVGRYYAKYCCSLSLIWDRNDILIGSSRYDDISRQIVKKVLSTLDEIEKKKSIK